MPTDENDLAALLRTKVRKAIETTITKFRENPFYFFTESDIHSYFYRVLYSSKFEINQNGKRIYLVHREYPTNFRYSKRALCCDDCTAPYSLDGAQGDRGNYDIAVINPVFVNTHRIEHVINKSLSLLKERVHFDPAAVRRELLFAIEFKYAIANTKKFVTEVLQDNKKLLFGTRCGVMTAVNLVFCNFEGGYAEQLRRQCVKPPQTCLPFSFSAITWTERRDRSLPLQIKATMVLSDSLVSR